jgi:hypothetical protein
MWQEEPVGQITVVDDASTVGANTAEFRDAGIDVVTLSDHRGVSGARNCGLDRCTSEWVAFLDDDDAWLPWHLRGILSAIASARDPSAVVLAYAPCVVTDGRRNARNLIPLPDADTLSRVLLGGNRLPTPSCVVVRTAAVREVGGFDRELSVSADWDLWVRVTKLGDSVASREPSVVYTHHGANLHHQADVILREIALLQERYGDEAKLRGVDLPDLGFARYMAGALRAAGRRREASRWYRESWRRRGTYLDAALAVTTLLGVTRPAWLRKRSLDLQPKVHGALRALRDVDDGNQPITGSAGATAPGTAR